MRIIHLETRGVLGIAVGAARKPPVFMQPGDVFEVGIEGLGILTNSVQDGCESVQGMNCSVS